MRDSSDYTRLKKLQVLSNAYCATKDTPKYRAPTRDSYDPNRVGNNPSAAVRTKELCTPTIKHDTFPTCQYTCGKQPHF